MEYKDVDGNIIKETEKAVYVGIKYYTEKGSLEGKVARMWCPRTCCVIEHEKVTKVANFILDKWVKELYDYMETKGVRKMPCVYFDKKYKEEEEARKQKAKEEYASFCQNVLDIMIKELQPYADRNLQEIGAFSKSLGEYLLNKGMPIDKCEGLMKLGESILKGFGSCNKEEWIDEYFAKEQPSKDDIVGMLKQYEGDTISYGCPYSGLDHYYNPKYSVSCMKDYYISGITYNKGNGGLYKAFKKHVIAYDKVIELAFSAISNH